MTGTAFTAATLGTALYSEMVDQACNYDSLQAAADEYVETVVETAREIGVDAHAAWDILTDLIVANHPEIEI